MENSNNMVTDWSKLEQDFYGTFNLSYADFSRKNNISEPNQELLDKWVMQTIERFSKIEPIEGVINFFEIPSKYNDTIRLRHYKVTCDGVRNNNLEKNFMIRLHLRTQPTSDIE